MADKSTRKELREPDEFITFTTKVVKWIQENKFRLLSISLAIVLIFASIFGYQWYRESIIRKASQALIEAKKILDAEVAMPEETQDDESGQSTMPELKEGTYASEEDKLKAALAAFQKVRKDYADSLTANLASFYIGDCHSKLGNAKQAIAAYEAYLRASGLDGILSLFAIEGIASTFESLDELDKAKEQYQRMVQEPFGSNKILGMYHLARIMQMKGSAQEAANKFREILDLYPSSYLTNEIENRLASLPEPKTPEKPKVTKPATETTSKTEKDSGKNG